jgi:hypothetical protein
MNRNLAELKYEVGVHQDKMAELNSLIVNMEIERHVELVANQIKDGKTQSYDIRGALMRFLLDVKPYMK